MAKSLPSLTVDDIKADRLMAAFGSVAEFKTWLKAAVLTEVQRRELNKITVQAQDAKDAKVEELRTTLGNLEDAV